MQRTISNNEYRPYLYVLQNKYNELFRKNPSIQIRDRTGKFALKLEKSEGDYVNLEGETLVKVNWTPNNPKYVRDILAFINDEADIFTYESDIYHHHKYAVTEIEDMPVYNMHKWYWDMEWQQGGKHDGAITCIALYDNYDDEYTIFTWYPKEFDELMLVDTPIIDDTNSTLVYASSEAKMITNFLVHAVERNPDMLISWFGWKFDLPKLIERAIHHNIDIRMLSPFNEITGVYWNDGIELSKKIVNNYSPISQPIKGVITVPLDVAFERQWTDAQRGTLPSLALDYIAETVLKENKLTSEKFPDKNEFFARGWLEDRYNYLTYALQDVRLIKLIDDKNYTTEAIIALQRLLKAPFDACFYASNMASIYFMRNAYWKPRTGYKGEKMMYDGAMIYDPLSEATNGLHENVAAFDFASLYPSMMVARNISWETKSDTPTEFAINITTPRDFSPITEKNMLYYKTDKLGVLPQAVLELKKLRDEYKKNMRETTTDADYIKWNNNQMAVKRLMASFYGIIGYQGYSWADIDVAASITASAREAIRTVAFKVRELDAN